MGGGGREKESVCMIRIKIDGATPSSDVLTSDPDFLETCEIRLVCMSEA